MTPYEVDASLREILDPPLFSPSGTGLLDPIWTLFPGSATDKSFNQNQFNDLTKDMNLK